MAELLYVARSRLGLSQGEVARQLGVTQQSVADWEAGRKQPGSARWSALEDVLELPTGTLAAARGVAMPDASDALIRELEREARDLRKEADRAERRAQAAAERLERLRGDGAH